MIRSWLRAGLVCLAVLWALPGAGGGPPAGTKIDNVADAVYVDQAGTSVHIQSNLVRVITARVEGTSLVDDRNVTVAPGTRVVFKHTLSNSGNATTEYFLTYSNLVGDNFDLAGLTLYQDLNGNGSVDPGEPQIADGGSISLDSGASVSLLFVGDVPAGAVVGASARLSLTATSSTQHVAATNTDTATIEGASLRVAKTASTTSPNPNDEVTFTLAVTNPSASAAGGISASVDGATVQRVIVRDTIPLNTQFTAFVSSAPGTALYHLWGSPQHSYASAPPSDLAQVDAVAVAFDTFAGNANANLSFKVRINSNASGDIWNTANGFYNDGVRETAVDSNAVKLTLPVVPPALRYYTDATFTRPSSMTRIGSPLFVQATAAACNLDPLSVETKVIKLTSTLTGDIENFNASETGPNTGIFRIVPSVPTRDGAAYPVVAGNNTMEVLKNDTVIASMQGCGAASVTATMLIDPAGVVFDSRSNDPIVGATVTLIDVAGDGNGGRPGQPASVFEPDGVTPAQSSVVTATDGHYLFPLVRPSTYRLDVTVPNGYAYPSRVAMSQLPPGRRIDANGSFHGNFRINDDGVPVIIDVPADPAAASGLFVEKEALRKVVEVGDFVDYKVTVKNNTGVVLHDAVVQDRLPAGFTYVLNSVRLNGAPTANPDGSVGPLLTFRIGTLEAEGATLTYRLRVGPGAQQGDGTNSAQVSSGITHSNIAVAKVTIATGGIFSERGTVVGKVFLDCNANSFQNSGEIGMPGVRLYLEDGTFAITDEQGRFSFYGLSARTHVIKIDRSTLPGSAPLVSKNLRSALDGGSRFIDLTFGELHSADFGIAGCSEGLLKEAQSRRAKLKPNAEMQDALKASFPVDRQIQTDPMRSVQSSGFVGNGASNYTGDAPGTIPQPTATKVTAPKPANAAPGTTSASAGSNPMPAPSATGATTAAAAPAASASGQPAKSEMEEADDEMLGKLDNKLGFVDLTDGATLGARRSTVRVKAPAGTVFKLFVNKKEISDKLVGSKSEVPKMQSLIWAYVGVEFTPGQNEITVQQFDPFGNKRGEQTIKVFTPDRVGKLLIQPADTKFVADGKTPVKVRVRVNDVNGLIVKGRTYVTVTTNRGELRVKDLNANEPGIQTYIEDGAAEFEMMPPLEPGTAKIHVSNGEVEGTVLVDFTPEMRPMMAAGLVEFGLNFSALGNSIESVGAQDGFEQELKLFSARNSDGTVAFGSHAALMLKGKVKGETLLTMAYDSAKVTRERLFRDIQPDEYYPVYGDSSIRGYDAQTTGKAYLRLDHGKSYVMYGDYMTGDTGGTPSLGNYVRTLNGVRQHWENGRFNVSTFATRDTFRQVVVEIPANGTSGPYVLPNSNGLVNSEKVEILIRDRNQTGVILKTTPQSRFSDYEFEPLSGRLLFKSFIPTLDQDMNPVSIRITYEVDQGGEKFWVAGLNHRVKVNERLEFGGNVVVDRNPQDENTLASLNTRFKVADKTFFNAEVAQTDHSATGSGLGYRFELQRDSGNVQGRAWYGHTDTTFDNATAALNRGRGEAGARATVKLDSKTQLVGEFLRTEDTSTGNAMNGGQVGVSRLFSNKMRTEFGYRFSREERPASPSSIGITPNDMNVIESKLSMPVPHFERAEVTGEFDQDVLEADRRVAAVGAAYTLPQKTRLYMRHEFISSLGSTYSLNSQQSRNATMFGVESSYLKNTTAFSEYRVRNTIDTPEAEAAVGLRNSWQVRKGVALTTGLESIRTVSGRDNDSLALVGGLDYTASERWRGSTRLEWRGNTTGSSWLSTLGGAAKLSEEWTLLVRNVLNINQNATEHAHLQDRFQLGAAFRGVESPWNTLAMFELRRDTDDTSRNTMFDRKAAIASLVANYQVTPLLDMSARYAVKFALENSLGVRSTGRTQLAGGRITYQIGKRWDLGVLGSAMFNDVSRQVGTGTELGFLLTKNLWLSGGYNITGFAIDMGGEDVTRRGGFLRLRFKFDENIFRKNTQEK